MYDGACNTQIARTRVAGGSTWFSIHSLKAITILYATQMSNATPGAELWQETLLSNVGMHLLTQLSKFPM